MECLHEHKTEKVYRNCKFQDFCQAHKAKFKYKKRGLSPLVSFRPFFGLNAGIKHDSNQDGNGKNGDSPKCERVAVQRIVPEVPVARVEKERV